ncbi:AAA family ATPase [Xanthobacter aminoxidans]|uniref:AAA family ATPase n=1 Tax=Xanthobacter aminoxidans TaxID=186280 RepID=UPI002022F390|nr:ATP-binding protein [Xanthobacter aminoxidans]
MSEPARRAPRPDITAGLDRLEKFAQILHPKDAEEPILAAAPRIAIYEWLLELNARAELKSVGVKPRATALLYGPPGTGKTTLAHHLAARLGLPLVAVQAERLTSMYSNASAANLGELFDALAQVRGSCVLLLDEIDAIGSKRISHEDSASRDRNMVLTTLLTRIEGFEGIALAATNRKEDLDSALWRRFGMQISVDLPAVEERFAILKRYGVPFEFEEETLDLLVDLTAGSSPALLRQLMEGLKRAIVLAPRFRRPVGDLVDVLRGVTAAVAPHPGLPQPPLWKSFEGHAEALAALPWPPTRPARKGAA